MALAATEPATSSVAGTEMAYWLFSMRKTTGSLWMPAKFIASCQSPSEVAPSPELASTTPSLPEAWSW